MVIHGMSIFWWSNQVGIALEIIGAAIIVVGAFVSRRKIKGVPHTFGENLVEDIRDIISRQAIVELVGFGLLAVGLAMQFAGGLEAV